MANNRWRFKPGGDRFFHRLCRPPILQTDTASDVDPGLHMKLVVQLIFAVLFVMTMMSLISARHQIRRLTGEIILTK